MSLNLHLDKIEKLKIITDETRREEAPKDFTAMNVTFVVGRYSRQRQNLACYSLKRRKILHRFELFKR